jgi:protocatechuate 3,4-dioxygenase beta subunit
MSHDERLARRRLLALSLLMPAAPLLPGTRPTEGPYWKARSPRRASLLESGVGGPKLVVSGVVRGADCAPVAGATLDFWQADPSGSYDNTGFRLRGHQLSDAQGRYELVTVLPGVYPGRTRHIHVKVQAPGLPALTTQLYFPGEAANARDGLFERALVMRLEDGAGGKVGAFDFQLDPRRASRA